MTNEQIAVLVLKDQAGGYFLVPRTALEQGRVPEEHRAEVEQAIAAGGSDGDDVQGYFLASTLVEVRTPLQYHQDMIKILEQIQQQVGGRTR